MKLINNKEENIIGLLNKINYIIKSDMIKASKEFGLTPLQLMVLHCIRENKLVTMSDIARHLGLSKSTTSGIIDRMVKQGYIQRERNTQDKRVIYIKPGIKEKELTDKMIENHSEYVAEVFSKVDEKEKNLIKDSMQKLLEILSSEEKG